MKMVNIAHRQEITSLVSSLADRKRQDLDTLRAFLLSPETETKTTTSHQDFSGPTKETDHNTTKTPKIRGSSAGKRLFRCIALDIPLMILFASFCLVHVMRFAWTDYYVPIMTRARRTDDELLEEYTYYERACSEQDITDGFRKGDSNNITVGQALDDLLLHGATIIPDLITPPTISKLRNYLQRKNNIVKDEEIYPMSQGARRLSYGLEPTENEAVQEAIREITSHELLPQLLEEVLGVDPALSEITMIASYYGAEDQVVHSDTKSEGYAAQFSRTYLHSYSLFIPVQPVNSRMGVTKICTGTHYCTNDMAEICEREMFGVNEAYEDETWKAGDGALLNQQVWHGGSMHSDKNAPERILFILSFIARPQVGRDTRQLARGTYFHMKWNMWGHTWKDIARDSAESTTWPFNILRSLALWKPKSRNWGYDLLLSAVLRAANEQMGMEHEDLITFIALKMNKLLPKWLQGNSSYDEDVNVWHRYVQETLDNTFYFVRAVNAFALGLYLLISVVVAITARGSSARPPLVRTIFGRFVITHGIIAITAVYYTSRISQSEWGQSIVSGQAFMRPFPTPDEFTSERWETDPSIPQGTTTLPERLDVLIGTRFDARWLASYNQWLDYHPGNRVFGGIVRKWAYLYPMYNDLENDPFLLRNLVSNVVEQVDEETQGGRFLKQDHLSGDWVVQSETDSFDIVRTALAVESNPVVKKVDQELNFLVADYRYGRLRGTALAFESTMHLLKLRRLLLRSGRPLFYKRDEKSFTRLGPAVSVTGSGRFRPSSLVSELTPTLSKALDLPASDISAHQFAVGTKVMVYRNWDRIWAPGSVTAVTGDNFTVDVIYLDDGRFERNVSVRRLRRPVRVQEGVRAIVYMEDENSFGVISAVHASGSVDVVLDSGGRIEDLNPDYYDIQYPTF